MTFFDSSTVPWIGALASLIAGSATALGALGVFLMPRKNAKLEDAFMSFAAGVMLAAAFFGLILAGIHAAEKIGFSSISSVSIVIAGILLGSVFVWSLNHFIPHEHFEMGKHGLPDTLRLKRIWLFVIAIAIHNIPEGFAVAVALLAVGYNRSFSFVVASITGFLEPLGGLIGVLTLGIAQTFYPIILGFAGGSMLFIISDEIIPETHRKEHATLSTFCLLGGFVIMMFFDVLFG
jgi:ZIP family zinc transporter